MGIGLPVLILINGVVWSMGARRQEGSVVIGAWRKDRNELQLRFRRRATCVQTWARSDKSPHALLWTAKRKSAQRTYKGDVFAR